MWGMSSRSSRLGGEHRRARRIFDSGLVRATLRGPVEHAVLDIEGELDFSGADALLIAVRAIEQPVASIDLQHLDFIDLEGARALSSIVQILTESSGHEVVIAGASTSIDRIRQLISAREIILV